MPTTLAQLYPHAHTRRPVFIDYHDEIVALQCDNGRVFHMHQNLLISTSLHSRGSFNVPADEVTTSIYCAWLYRRTLGDHIVRLDDLDFDANLAMARLYALGIHVDDREVLDAVVRIMTTHPIVVTTVVIELIYTRTRQNDPVRRLLVDLCVRRPDLREVSRTVETTRPEFWADLQRCNRRYLEDTISERQVEVWQADADEYGSSP